MDAAARAGAGPARTAPPQLDPAEQMPYHQPDGADPRLAAASRPSSTRAWRWPTGRLRGARGRQAAPAARALASPPSWNGPAATSSRARHRQRHARRLHRDVLATQTMGQGIATSYAQPGGGRVRRAHRAHPHRAGRHRPRQRFRQRRQPLAVHRRQLGAVAAAAHVDRQGHWPPRRWRHRLPTSRYRGGRSCRGGHRPRHRPVGAGRRQPGTGIFVDSTSTWPAHLAQRLPCLRGRGRPRHRAVRWCLRVGERHRPWSARPSSARSTAARCRASARRCASASPTTPSSGQLLSASFMDYALPHADGFRDFKTVSTPASCLQQRAGRQGRGRAGHHRRHAGGGERGGRRPLASAGLGRDAERDADALHRRSGVGALKRATSDPPVFAADV